MRLTPTNYSLTQIHAHAVAQGYKQEVERLDHYLSLRAAEAAKRGRRVTGAVA